MVTLSPNVSSPGCMQQAFTLKFNGDDRTDVEQSGFKQAQSKQGMSKRGMSNNV